MTGFTFGPPTRIDAPPPASTVAAPTTAMVEFLTRALPTPGPGRVLAVCKPFVVSESGKDKTLYPATGYATVAEAVNSIQYWQNRNPESFFIAMALFKNAIEKPSKGGRTRLTVNRKDVNAVAKKGFYADLDVKPGAYASQADALAKIDSLVASGVLPVPTTIVSSGYGVHVHWILDQETTDFPRWDRAARAMGDLLTANGVHHDPQACNDLVRLLRAPGMLNCKNAAAPKPVAFLRPLAATDYTLAAFEAAVASYIGRSAPAANRALPMSSTVPWVGSGAGSGVANAAMAGNTALVLPFPARVGPAPAPSNFSAGIEEHRAQPVALEKVIASCPTFADIHARGGNGDPEPLWALAILATTFMIDGRAKAHELSKGDPRYDPASTDAKYAQKEADRAASGGKIGWPTCRAFSALSAHCQTCPMLAHNKSPLNGGADDSDLPPGYFRRNGVIWTTRTNTDSNGNVSQEDVLVLAYGVRDAYLEYTDMGPALSIEILHPQHAPTRMVLAIAHVNTWQKGALDTLARAHITLKKARQDGIQEFFVAFIQDIQARQGVSQQREQFGWTETRAKQPAFAFGGTLYGGASHESSTGGDPVMAGIYTPAGSLEAWKRVAKFITDQRRPELDIVLGASFGSPLVKFSGVTGLLLSAFSTESGRGKTTALEAALAVWGDPVAGKNKLADTMNQVGRKLGMLRHLPIFWDEIQSEETADAISQLAFSLTLGSEKGRLNADSTIKHSGSWATLLVAATNNSIREIMLRGAGKNSAAGVNRVLEFEVPAIPPSAAVSMDVAQGFATLVKSNYGHAGKVYAEFLAAKHSTHAAALERVIKYFAGAFQATPEERFWVIGAASVMLGATYANHLNLTTIDLAALRARLLGVLNEQRVGRKANVVALDSLDHAADVVFRYIAYCRMRNTCLETESLPKGQGRQVPAKLCMPSADAERALRNPVLHIAHDDAKVRVLPSEFRRWLVEVDKVPVEATMRALTTHASAQLYRATWAPATAFRSGQTLIMELDLHPSTPIGSRFGYGPKPPASAGSGAGASGTP